MEQDTKEMVKNEMERTTSEDSLHDENTILILPKVTIWL